MAGVARGAVRPLHRPVGLLCPFAPAKKAHPAFCVQGLDALRERLRARGVDVQDGGSLPGARRLNAHDPFGNCLEFLEWE